MTSSRMPLPVLNDRVHYTSYGSQGGRYRSVCRAADVTEVGGWITDPDHVDVPEVDGASRVQHWHPDAATLLVKNPTGWFLNPCPRGLPGYAAGDTGPAAVPSYEGGTWHPAEECGPR